MSGDGSGSNRAEHILAVGAPHQPLEPALGKDPIALLPSKRVIHILIELVERELAPENYAGRPGR